MIQLDMTRRGSPLRQVRVVVRDDIATGTLTIGRAWTNDLVLEDASRTVSRYHSAIIRLPGDDRELLIRDLSSRNSTRVGHSVVCRKALKEGDIIATGDYDIACHFPGEEPPEAAPRAPSKVHGFLAECLDVILASANADRGFIALCDNQFGAFNALVSRMEKNSRIRIADESFRDSLRSRQYVHEGRLLLTPPCKEEEVVGFLCVHGKPHKHPLSTGDVQRLNLLGNKTMHPRTLAQHEEFASSRHTREDIPLKAYDRKVIDRGVEEEWLPTELVARKGPGMPAIDIDEEVFEGLLRREQIVSLVDEAVRWGVEWIGDSGKMNKAYEQIRRAVQSDANVLITGQTGTG